MRRIVWVAVGAVGGIVIYKRAQQTIAEAKERGVVGSAQHWGQSAADAVSSVREFAIGTGGRRPSQESLRGFRRDS